MAKGAIMNRKRIQAVFLLVILSAFLCFSSCRKKKNTEADRHRNDISEVIGTESVVNTYTAAASLTEKYALYHSNNGQLRIFDANSKTDIVFCFNPGCEHEKEKRTITGELLKEGCPSYNYSSWAVFLDGDSCVFLRDNGEVIRSDRQGENRRVIATIPSYLSIGTNDVFYAGNSMFIYTANHYEITEMKDSNGNSQWAIGDTKDTQDCRLIRVDLTDGKITEVFQKEAYNAIIWKHDVRGEHVYFECFYLDIPYVGPNLETYGPSHSIPEGMTVENYWEEMSKHRFVDIYDYYIATGELRTILSGQNNKDAVVFGRDFFALTEDNKSTMLYHYDGQPYLQLDCAVTVDVRTDEHLVCHGQENGEYLMINEENGEILKRVQMPENTINLEAIIGDSCYGLVNGPDGWGAGYISAEDFWNGKIENAIPFNVQ
ncbi:MAG: hypothetical protein IKX20_01935 [Paludibacteraceae bacterium]|nr:hypothetical protein [Paludibacteraceae bacterium]